MYVGLAPTFCGVAVKVTDSPAQIVLFVASEVIETVAGLFSSQSCPYPLNDASKNKEIIKNPESNFFSIVMCIRSFQLL